MGITRGDIHSFVMGCYEVWIFSNLFCDIERSKTEHGANLEEPKQRFGVKTHSVVVMSPEC